MRQGASRGPPQGRGTRARVSPSRLVPSDRSRSPPGAVTGAIDGPQAQALAVVASVSRQTVSGCHQSPGVPSLSGAVHSPRGCAGTLCLQRPETGFSASSSPSPCPPAERVQGPLTPCSRPARLLPLPCCVSCIFLLPGLVLECSNSHRHRRPSSWPWSRPGIPPEEEWVVVEKRICPCGVRQKGDQKAPARCPGAEPDSLGWIPASWRDSWVALVTPWPLRAPVFL